MYISQVKLKGFRNFKNASINLAKKSLIIGSNDIGKSNLLYSLRILLDKNLSEADLEPRNSDFYVFEDTNEFEILIEFKEVNEDCVLSKMREYVSDDAQLILAYRATRDPETRKTDFTLFAGKDESSLSEIDSRYYLRVLNLKFIGSRRDLFSYIRRERKNLIKDAKSNRSEEEIEEDSETLEQIETSLEDVNEGVRNLSYISKATETVNAELELLSFRNIGRDVIFDTGASDPSIFVDNLRLASRVQGKTLVIGGDGRNNQIHLALWSARNNKSTEPEEEPLEVCVFCIEEPEAHLHPHQQRKLAEYLSETINAQVILTTHSPQITSEFAPASIIRLFDNQPDTLAAGDGINPFTESAFIQFGHRLNIIPAEAFFSDVVLLVEGPSEELFYKALASQIGIDLDRLNISVLMVDGVGFKPYLSLLTSLRINWVVRTDNDIFKIPQHEAYRFAGIQRGISFYREYFEEDEEFEALLDEEEDTLSGFTTKPPPDEVLEVAQEFIEALEDFEIFLAHEDLEHDLHKALGEIITDYLDEIEDEDAIYEMQKQKATFMFSFLSKNLASLADLADDPLAKPLIRCKELVEASYVDIPDN